jgi:fructosamine-3-kinase
MQSRAVAGGDLSTVIAIELVDGRTAIVKGGQAPATEAAMLDAIRSAGAPAPAVLAFDDDVLVIERIETGGVIDRAWQDLGRVLAELHAAAGADYGWEAEYAFGAVAIENSRSDNWPEFWGKRRLLNQLPYLSADLARRVEALARDLPDRLPLKPLPSLLHGDLWGGNVLVAGNRVTGLIDPACYYGHSEVDFAMLGLFNGPGPELFGAYGGLEAGYAERLPVYQLWPALVHLRLFGTGYRSLVERLLAATGV